MKKPKSKPTLPNAPATITAEQLASLCNLTKRRLYQLADEHKIPQPVNGCFPMLESITAMFAYYQRDGADLQREKLLKTAAERKLREHELAVMEGRLCDAKTAQMAVTGVAMHYHALVKKQLDRNFAQMVLERLEGLDEPTRQRIYNAALEAGRSVVGAIEVDCQKYGR